MELNNQATREIIAKTICGSGFKVIEYNQYIELPKDILPSRIMGCTITNVEKPKALKWKVPENNRYYVPVKGSVNIDAWYAFNDGHDTSVASTTIVYHENIPILERSGKPIGSVVATAEMDEDPKVADVGLEGNKIRITVLIKISTVVMGDSRLMVEVME